MNLLVALVAASTVQQANADFSFLEWLIPAGFPKSDWCCKLDREFTSFCCVCDVDYNAVIDAVVLPSGRKAPRLVGEWERTRKYPEPLGEAQGWMMGENKDDLMVIGGFTDFDGVFNNLATKRNYALDLTKWWGRWRRLQDLPNSDGITHGAYVVVENLFYMCGGYLGGHPGPHVPDCFVYDYTADQWDRLPNLPEGRGGGGMIYDKPTNSLVFAGGAERPNLGEVGSVDYGHCWQLMLDDTAGGWMERTDIPYLSNHISFVTATDDMGEVHYYFLGGQMGDEDFEGNTDSFYELTVASDSVTWTQKNPIPFARGHAASSTRPIANGFFMAAGTTNTGLTADVSYYDIPTDTWSKMGDIPDQLYTPVCDISGDYMYCETGDQLCRFSFRRKLEM